MGVGPGPIQKLDQLVGVGSWGSELQLLPFPQPPTQAIFLVLSPACCYLSSIPSYPRPHPSEPLFCFIPPDSPLLLLTYSEYMVPARILTLWSK
jgi:hypothetical protein